MIPGAGSRVLPPRCSKCQQIVIQHCPESNEVCPWVRCPTDGVQREVGTPVPPINDKDAPR